MMQGAGPVSMGLTWSVEELWWLKALAAEGAPAEAISLKLSRPAAEVSARAAEYGLTLKRAR
ncbi:hypothetical protein RUR49_15595 [Pseudoxanthobacter sp. M-2]|uniref:hypothetical protein n=1 Tax=Pseudoxanthobacter sp. M-2 TaxID=3078754 RepID=UPI0038FCD13B